MNKVRNKFQKKNIFKIFKKIKYGKLFIGLLTYNEKYNFLYNSVQSFQWIRRLYRNEKKNPLIKTQ